MEKLEDALADTDVLYVTRIQRERFDSEEEYKKVRLFNFHNFMLSLSVLSFTFLGFVTDQLLSHLPLPLPFGIRGFSSCSA